MGRAAGQRVRDRLAASSRGPAEGDSIAAVHERIEALHDPEGYGRGHPDGSRVPKRP